MITEETLSLLERELGSTQQSTTVDVARILIREIRNLKSAIEYINAEWDFQNSLVDRKMKAQEDEIQSLKAQLNENGQTAQ